MEYFNVTQDCVHCFLGAKLFKVDLNCYDREGKLIVTSTDMDRFSFICSFCHRKTNLDFQRFSHPDLIIHLKRICQQYEEIMKQLDILNSLFNNMKK